MSFTEKVTVVLNQITDKFQEHPKENGQSYLQHFWNSSYFSLCSLVCSVVFMLHAIFPFLFEKTGGNLVYHLEQQISGIRDCSPRKTEEANTSETQIGLVGEPEADQVDDPSETKEGCTCDSPCGCGEMCECTNGCADSGTNGECADTANTASADIVNDSSSELEDF